MQSGGNSTFPDGSNETPAWDGEDRRAGDRREAPTRPFGSRFVPRRRRTGGRRDEDHSSYVDRYSRHDVALILTIFLLNVADAFFTMLWLGRGGREANPVMDFFLDIGPMAFLIQKCVIVGLWLLVLIVHKNFRFARLGIYASLIVYALLLIVHFGIIALGIEPPPREVDPTTRVEGLPADPHARSELLRGSGVSVDSPNLPLLPLGRAESSDQARRPTSSGMTGSTRSTLSPSPTGSKPIARSRPTS